MSFWAGGGRFTIAIMDQQYELTLLLIGILLKMITDFNQVSHKRDRNEPC